MITRIVAGLAITLALAGAVQAQTRVTASSPAANAHVMQPVTEIRITFDQDVDASRVVASVKTSAGAAVKTGPAKVEGREVVLPVEGGKLAEGWYTVEWMIHGAQHVQGTYTFMAM